MLVLPAIDIKDKNCVRLYKGDFATAEKVADSYMETALGFKAAGAEWVHMVDLDGARDGVLRNKEIFLDVVKKSGLKVELGGGIRTSEAIEMYLSEGISRIVLGSIAVSNPEFVKRAVREYGEFIAVGIDARDGKIATDGWIRSSNLNYIDLAVEMANSGAKYFIYTNIDKDGTLEGVDLEGTMRLQEAVSEYGAKVIASGGIKSITDIEKLKNANVYGAICGKSVYSGSLDLKAAIALQNV